ncbi:MAG: hypothetical protein H4O13_11880 [Xanthomonadales bacterium]|nr:hypothetical protein [Xanthomonadales bacterium]
MNRPLLLALTCALCASLFLTACGNRGPLVLPEDAPPPMPMPVPAEPATPAEAQSGKDGSGQ